MSKLVYIIKKIPDLSLVRYQGLESSGVDGLISIQKHLFNLFLKNSYLSGTTFSLIYKFNSNKAKGNRIEVFLIFSGDDEDLHYLKKLIEANSINIYYDLQLYSSLENNNYSHVGFITKKEKYIRDVSDPFNSDEYYQVSSWETEEKNRYLSLFHLMSLFNDDIEFRIDFKTVNYYEDLEQTILNVNRNLLSKKAGNSYSHLNNKILKYNENLLKKYEESIQIKSYISCFSNNVLDIYSTLNSVGAEAIEKGEYSIYIIDGNFSDDFLSEVSNKFNNFYTPLINKDIYNNIIICKEKTNKWGLGYLPTLFTLDEISPFYRLPILYENEEIEIPKETSNLLIQAEENQLIELAIDDHGYKVSLPITDINKHLFICGIPGSGKTTTMHRLLIEFIKNEIPFLVFEPAKSEYRELLTMGLDDILIFSPKPSTLFKLEINPFEFPVGISLSEHISNLLSIFTGTFYFPSPTPMIIEESIENIYKKQGWDLLEINKADKLYPSLVDFYKEISNVIDTKDYSQENKDNMKGICEIRIGNLLKREKGEIFGTDYSTIRPNNWINISAIIELESLDSNSANFVTLLLSTYIRETLKVNHTESKGKPRHVLLFEEAHNLITSNLDIGEETANVKVSSTNYIIKMLAEVRALREGIIIADQLPSAMAPEILKNTSTKIIHKITANDELERVAQTTNATPIQLENISTFDKGEVLMDIESLIKPFKCRIKNVEQHGQAGINDEKLYSIYCKGKAYSLLEKFKKESEYYYDIKNSYIKYKEKLEFVYNEMLKHYDTIKFMEKYKDDNSFEIKKLYRKYINDSINDSNNVCTLKEKGVMIMKAFTEDEKLFKTLKDDLLNLYIKIAIYQEAFDEAKKVLDKEV